MDENDSLRTMIIDLFKGEKDYLLNEISPERLKEKISVGKWIELDGMKIYQEAEWWGCAYTHNEKIKINISKLNVHHSDNSIEYLFHLLMAKSGLGRSIPSYSTWLILSGCIK